MQLLKYICKNDCPRFYISQFDQRGNGKNGEARFWCPFCQNDGIEIDDILDVKIQGSTSTPDDVLQQVKKVLKSEDED